MFELAGSSSWVLRLGAGVSSGLESLSSSAIGAGSATVFGLIVISNRPSSRQANRVAVSGSVVSVGTPLVSLLLIIAFTVTPCGLYCFLRMICWWLPQLWSYLTPKCSRGEGLATPQEVPGFV